MNQTNRLTSATLVTLATLVTSGTYFYASAYLQINSSPTFRRQFSVRRSVVFASLVDTSHQQLVGRGNAGSRGEIVFFDGGDGRVTTQAADSTTADGFCGRHANRPIESSQENGSPESLSPAPFSCRMVGVVGVCDRRGYEN